METPSLLEAFEKADLAGKRALLRNNQPLDGFSEQFFLRVAQLLGQNPVAAQNLAEGWSVVSKFGDDPAFAWRSKGALERIKGNWASSAKAFIRSGNLARGETEQISFQTGAIDSLARAGKTTAAVKLGKSIARKLESIGQRALAGRAWLNTGNAYLWADKHNEARRCFLIAYELLRDTPFRLEASSARLGASTSALYIDLPSRSLALAEEARDEMMSIGATFYGHHAQVNVGQCHVMMGRADEAVRIFAELRSTTDPKSLEYTRLGQFLGDAWLALQVFDAAGDAFQSALDSPGIGQSPLNHGYILVGLGEVRLQQGRPEEARGLFRKASQIHRRIGNFAANNLGRIGFAQAEIALNHKKSAAKILNDTVVDLRSRRMWRYLAGALLDLASIQKDNKDLLIEANRIVRKYGFISEIWRIHSIQAESAKNLNDAIKEFRKMVNAILNHRVRLSSVTARTSLIEPSLASIRDYLGILIDKNTKKSTDEAIQVISNLRSVTLLDEFLLATGESLSSTAKDVLSRIRKEVSTEGENQLPGGPLRLLSKGVWSKPSLVRQYLEHIGMNRLGEKVLPGSHESETRVNTFVFLRKGSAWLSPNHTLSIDLSREELIKRLRWIHFELMAPLSGFACDDKRLNREIERLKMDLKVDLLDMVGDLCHLSVEDVAYQIPWALLYQNETVLHLRPAAGVSASKCFLGPRSKVGIWYFSREELPHIDSEVARIRNMFPQAQIYSTVEEILRSADQESFDLIHVAAHGRYDHENPMFSSIQLADGHLLACDIARSNFRTRIAVLASCDSATMGQPTGWEPQGLARAFLARRSEVVIGSLWPLNDQVAEFGFGSFYRKLLAGYSVSSALSESRSELKEKFEHPAFWGSLVMFGGYSS